MKFLAFVLGLVPISAYATEDCETLFRSAHKGDTWEFISHQPLQGRTVQETVGNLKEIFARQGLTTFPFPDEGGQSRLGVVQKAKGNNPEVLLIAFVDANAASLVTNLADSMTNDDVLRGDPKYMQGLMCGALASAATDGSKVAGLALDGAPAKVARPVDSRTAPPPDNPGGRVLQPGVKFNAEAAKEALLPGTNTITGTACARYSGQLVLASNLPVYLYPVTPYLTEVMDLVKKVRDGDTLTTDPDWQTVRLDGSTNARGQFQFSRLKPGEYMIFTQIDSSIERQRDVDVGTAYTGVGAVSIIGKENYVTNYSTEATKIVRVDGEGKTLKVRLSPPFKLFSGGHAGILGCSSL